MVIYKDDLLGKNTLEPNRIDRGDETLDKR